MVDHNTQPDRSDGIDHDRPDHDPSGLEARRPVGAAVVSPKLKTSAAATFSLVFGLSALFCALAVLLSPLAVVFGIIGIVLGIVGLKKVKEIHVTGKGVATGGLVLSVLGLLLGAALLAGAAGFLSDDQNLQRIEDRLEDLRDQVPTELPDTPLTD